MPMINKTTYSQLLIGSRRVRKYRHSWSVVWNAGERCSRMYLIHDCWSFVRSSDCVFRLKRMQGKRKISCSTVLTCTMSRCLFAFSIEYKVCYSISLKLSIVSGEDKHIYVILCCIAFQVVPNGYRSEKVA